MQRLLSVHKLNVFEYTHVINCFPFTLLELWPVYVVSNLKFSHISERLCFHLASTHNEKILSSASTEILFPLLKVSFPFDGLSLLLA